ncbi:MAG: hypothetical protein ACHQNA_11665 [Acidimicrobiales bacterium]
MHDERHLLAGDTLAWFWREHDLAAFRDATWYSWTTLQASLRRFPASGHGFEWIFPGHGTWHGAPEEEMRWRLTMLVERMERGQASRRESSTAPRTSATTA